MTRIVESELEETVLDYFEQIGWSIQHGPAISPGGSTPERATYADVLLKPRLEAAVRRINPAATDAVVDAAIGKLRSRESANLLSENLRWYLLLRDGVPVEVRIGPGDVRTIKVDVIDWADSTRNDFLAVNQLTVIEPSGKRRTDVVAFVNGIPLALFELKSPENEQATVQKAFRQVKTYEREIPSLFGPLAFSVIADGALARIGPVGADLDWYSWWRTTDSEDVEPPEVPQIKVAILGMFERTRFLEIVARFIDFGTTSTGLRKRMALYNQYWAVKAAISNVVRASAPDGDRRAGIVYHGQGSGKSMELLLTANYLSRLPSMGNPTIVVISDRNDLDNQILTNEFGPSRILGEKPEQASDRQHLATLLRRPGGGMAITTIQKFQPARGENTVLTDRRNVVVMADEAHRSQYNFLSGYARSMRDALPNATYLGFTGTPLEEADRSTRGVFGDYISRYSPEQSVDDETTVPIFYEARTAHVRLTQESQEFLDAAVSQLPDEVDEAEQRKAFRQWGRLEAILGAEAVVDRIVDDFIAHWEDRRSRLPGKAMLACQSRSIAAAVFAKIVQRRPQWHDPDDKKGKVKVVYSGNATDEDDVRIHVRSGTALEAIKRRMQKPGDELEIVVVCDLWLTGFDSPPLHTLYLAKLLRGHTLFQAITRTNRKFKDKPSGLVVSYVPILNALHDAIASFSGSGGGSATADLSVAAAALLEKHDIVIGILAGHEWDSSNAERTVFYERAASTAAWLAREDDRRARYLDQSLALAKAWAIAGGTDAGLRVRDDVDYLLTVRGVLAKLGSDERIGQPTTLGFDSILADLVNGAVEADDVIDVYATLGKGRPEISLLSEEFLASLRQKNERSLQVELLRKILNDEIRALGRRNIVRGRALSEILAAAILRYHNRSLTDAEVLNELVQLARDLRSEQARSEREGLNDAELAFYDAVAQNDSAVEILGDATLKEIARELVHSVRESATIDWRDRESARAEMRVKIKTLLRRFGYPPDAQEAATLLVIEQARLFADDVLGG